MLQRARLGLVLLLAISLLFLSCASNGGDSAPASGGPGKLIFSRPDAITELDIATGDRTDLVRAGAVNSFLLDPAISPDGKHIAYVRQPPAQIIDGRYDAGTDLWVADRDGSGARMLYQHTQSNALARYPRWTPDGDIIAIIQEIEETPRITLVTNTVQRVDVETGARTKLLDDAYAIAISPDGSRLAYARPLPEGGEAFESIALDGSGGEPAVLVAASENLLPFNSPEYAPAGATIAFASAEQPPVPVGWLASTARVPAALDGLPQDIWLVDAAGGRPRVLAPLKEDLPSLTWSGDGEHVYVLGAGGLYDVNVVSFAVTRIGEGVFHGQIDWAP